MIGWDYEETTESYYHIYWDDPHGDGGSITYVAPQTKLRDSMCTLIVEALKMLWYEVPG